MHTGRGVSERMGVHDMWWGASGQINAHTLVGNAGPSDVRLYRQGSAQENATKKSDRQGITGLSGAWRETKLG